MTLEEAREEARVIFDLRISDPDQAAKYLLLLVTDAYGSGWDAAFDTAPDNFKPERRRPRFTLEKAR